MQELMKNKNAPITGQLLKNKKALITGGTSGLGKAIALEFAKQGASVVIFGTNEERAKKVHDELNQAKTSDNQQMHYELIDVSDTTAVHELTAKLLKEFGTIDVLVNCAGITRDNLLMKMTEEDWDRVINVNLKSVYNLSHALLRSMMKARTGKIINISSVIGLTGNPGQVNYAASKSGMIGFTRSLAREVGSRGICVNCIAPGFFQTSMTDVLTETQREGILQKVPMQRLGQPEELAQTALFLASEMSDYITGQVIAVDGGMLA